MNINKYPFTEEQMRQIFETSLVDYAIRNGFRLKNSDSRTFKVEKMGGLFIFKNGKGFYHFTTNKKGNILDFAKEYLGLDFKQAVESILGIRAYENNIGSFYLHKEKEKKSFKLPPKAENFNRVIDYLVQTRKLDKEIVHLFINEDKIYQSKEENKKGIFYNCAFVGYDENNIAKYCSLRGMSLKSNFRKDIESSDKQYGFNFNGTSQNLYVFESPIDLMSHMTIFKIENKIDWKKDSRLSCGGLFDMAIDTYLEHHNNIENIIFCFDNDVGKKENYGQEKAQEFGKKYKELGYKCYLQTPKNKDFNQDLVEKVKEMNNKIYKAKGIEYDELER
ncbi:DUF3991 and TOPRIM domain-containing protein [uncultured Tyzzerella sp.]|uniref:DUF3991 and TOPRIM domain-containing protein n=1 Tax=uncultured Tyzzerella sp. TaxID=2321398 RepID=UPI0029438751|nr:DUF3991 and TOPRIM domain-containing protein [uncultured Tyzzerella sp.]